MECGHLLDPVSCKPIIISPALFVKWSDLLCETYVLKWGRTYCPYRVCSELIVNESGGTVKKSKCPNFSKDFCFQCGVEWYAGYRCDEIEGTRDMNDVLLRQPAKNKKWPACPCCRRCVELDGGCAVMTCRFVIPLR